MNTTRFEETPGTREGILYKDAKCEISVREVLRLLGARKESAPARTVRKIRTLINELHDDLEPRILVSDKEILACGEGRLVLDPGVELKSKKLCRTFSKCDTAKVFVATVGNKVEKKIKTAIENNRSDEASIIDAIASAAVENTIESFHSKVDMNLRTRSRRATLRFSPGYCDWDIREQKKLFKLIDTQKAGVKLSDSSLMSPRKSISGIIGIGSSSELSARTSNPCMLCDNKACNTRRATN
jgi:hypothetical protein